METVPEDIEVSFCTAGMYLLKFVDGSVVEAVSRIFLLEMGSGDFFGIVLFRKPDPVVPLKKEKFPKTFHIRPGNRYAAGKGALSAFKKRNKTITLQGRKGRRFKLLKNTDFETATDPAGIPEFYQQVFRESPVAQLVYLGDDMILGAANEAMLHIFGRNAAIIGRPIMESLPEFRETRLLEYYREVLCTGVAYEAFAHHIQIFREGISHWGYYDYTYKPLINAAGKVIGVNCTAVEVSERVEALQKLEDSELFARDIITHSPVAKLVFTGEDMCIHTVNEKMLQILHRNAEDVMGKPFMEAIPEFIGMPLMDRLRHVRQTGETYYQSEEALELLKEGRLQMGYYNYVYKALYNAAGEVWGVMCTANEVTAQVEARKTAQTSEIRFRSLIEEAPVATCVFRGEEMVIEIANEAMLSHWGRDTEVLGKPLLLALPELEGQGFLELLQSVFRTGEPYAASDVVAVLEIGGQLLPSYFDINYKALRDESGTIYGVMNTAINVTEKLLARRQKEAAEQRLRNAIDIAELGTWNLEVATGRITFSERMQEWLGLPEAQLDLHNTPAGLPQPILDLRAALQPGSGGSFDKTYGITNSQTGRSRIIRANGQVLFGTDGNALSIAGSAQDITEQQERQTALENEVQVRTEELASAVEELQATNEELEEANTQLRHSNEELAQYAYVASHDLQEPLRKIRIFTDMVAGSAELSAGTKITVAKISQSAERMSLLIQDLLAFSRLLKSDRLVRPVSLRETVEAVWSDYELKVAELGATLEMRDLPVIEGVSLQINQLFYNLLGNALKFVRPGVLPHIKVESSAAGEELKEAHLNVPLPFTTYYHLRITDNGIGFDTEYSEHIFEVFKRLHGRDMYPGSGIGLALCRRIAANHNGALWAESVVGQGTTFHILLPARQHQTVSEFGTTFEFPKP